MPQHLLIRGARQLLTLRSPDGLRRSEALSELGIIPDGSVLIRDGAIASVGSTRRLENMKEARGVPEIDIHGAIVMPGFVDPSIEIATPPPAAEARKKTRSSALYEESLSLLRSCMQHGTLHAQLKAVSPEPHARPGVSLLRQFSLIGDHPVGVVRTWSLPHAFPNDSAEADEHHAALSLLARRRFAHALELSPASEEPVRSLIRGSEGLFRFQLGLRWNGGAPDTLAGLLASTAFRSVSCVTAPTPEVSSVLAAAPVPVVVSPGGSLAEEAQRTDVRDLVRRGAAIALSTGYHSEETPTFNMQMAIALAVNRLGLSTEQAIAAATVNAAHAIGKGSSVGSLEVGKRADLLILNLPDYREIPRRFGTNHVGMVIREGKILMNRTGWKVSAA